MLLFFFFVSKDGYSCFLFGLRDLESRRRRVRHARSAGLVVIGDEVLKGKCQDLNTAFATHKLWEKVGS